MKTTRANRWIALLALVCVLVLAFAVPVASAASYSKVYGKTLDRLRVRVSASTSATVTDNIVKGACVYVTSSKTSGSNTFIEIKYINSDGSTSTGWLCQSDGKTKYVSILSAEQAKSTFGVADGKLPSKKVGTFTAAQRKAGSSSSSGSTSSDIVKDAQTKLKALGYYSAEITGKIGAKTETAIKAFQRKQGLTADGKLGTKTIEALNKAYANKSGSSSSTDTTASLKLNSTGTAVSLLQQNLAKLGYYYAEITGHYGSKTEAAVKKFQKAKGLTADGVAGTKTLEAIASAVGKGGSSSSSSSSASGYGRITGSNVNLRKSASTSGAKITTLSKGTVFTILSSTSSWYKISVKIGSITHEGYVHSDYVEKITASQFASSGGSSGYHDDDYLGTVTVTASGVNLREGPGQHYDSVGKANRGDTFTAVDKQGSWYKLSKGYWIHSDFVTFNSATSGSTSFNGPYQEGDSGDIIRTIQTALKALGWYGDGYNITGNFGRGTKEAVREFQRANGLSGTGIVDKATYNELMSQYRGTTGTSSAKLKEYASQIYQVDWSSSTSKNALINHGADRKDGSNRTLMLTDLRSLKNGKDKSFYIQVLWTGNHLDVEPLNLSSTNTMLDIYGVSNVDKISHIRRPMLLSILDSSGKVRYQVVCSMYGQAHNESETLIHNNGFDGQFCLHFTNSKTSGSGKVDADHQAAIKEAMKILKDLGRTTTDDLPIMK